MRIASSFIQFFKKEKPAFDKSLKIHKNGEHNNYPDIVERLIEESVTASQCSDLMSDYVSGRGFGDAFNDLILNSKDLTTGMEFVNQIAKSWVDHKGVFIHVNFNANYEIIDPSVLPFTDCRIGKKDDDNYAGKILVCDDWTDSKKARQAKAIDIYNPRKEVIQAQIEAAGGIDQYKGQILYVKDAQKIYPLSRIHPVMNDADSEAQTSVFKNRSLRKGFFGKTMVVTKPLVDSSLRGVDDPAYNEQLNQRDELKKTLNQFLGAENVDGLLLAEMEFESDDIEKELLFKNIDSNIDDKIFAHTERSVSENIRAVFKNIPAPLVRSQDGALFGSSGEAIKEMKLFYQDQTENDRMKVQEIVRTIMSRYKDPMKDLTIIPLIEKPQSNAD